MTLPARRPPLRRIDPGDASPLLSAPRLEAIVNAGPAVVYTDIAGPDLTTTYVSANARRVLGMAPEELVGSGDFMARIHPADRDRIEAEMVRILADGGGVQEYRFLHPDGTYRWLRDEMRVALDETGMPADIIGYLTDVTAEHRTSSQLHLLAATIAQSSEAAVLMNAAETIVYVNGAFEALTGIPSAQAVGRPGAQLAAMQHVGEYADVMAAVAAVGVWRGCIRGTRSDGTAYFAETTVSPIVDESGAVTHMAAVFRDVTEERRLTVALNESAAQRAAFSAAMARLATETTVEATAQLIADEALTLPGVALSIVLATRNGVGAIPVATAGLTQPVPESCARYIRARVRSGSVVEDWHEHRMRHADVECRWMEAGLQAVAAAPLRWDGRHAGILVVGSRTMDSIATLRTLRPRVDEYAALAAAVLGPKLAELREADDLRGAVDRVIARREFHPVFQPVVNMEHRTVVGYEALSRFDDGTAPDARFARAWSVGRGTELELATLRAAVEAAAVLPPTAWLSLNASPAVVLDERLPDLLARVARPLVIEVTEQARVEDYGAVLRAMERLAPGTRLAVDDAGAGFASLRHIIELRPGIVKLDRGLVTGIDADPVRQALVTGMVHFAGEIGSDLLAEGIETLQERDTLIRLGVVLGQGFLLGRPERVG